MKQFKRLLLALVLCFSIIPISVYANATETTEVEKEFSIEVSNEEIKNEKTFTVDVVEEKKEVKKDEKPIIQVDGGISKEEMKELLDSYNRSQNRGVSSLATLPSKARGTVIENVGADNKDYPIRRDIGTKEVVIKKPNGDTTNTSTQTKERPSSDARQFLTFTTKSGKVFHLIIDHDKTSENVQLLTEVSEMDLLNMIETKEVKEEPKVEVKKEEPKEEVKKEPKKQSSLGSYFILGLVLVGALGAGYYFRIVKPKQEDDFDFEEESDDEFFEESSEEIKEEDNEKDSGMDAE
ncbi:CD1107 family mobile element protein [Clostridium perfringens]